MSDFDPVPAAVQPADERVPWEADCGQCRACQDHHFEPSRNPMADLMATQRFIVCATCGNKRCPHATDHRLACTGSNEPNQPGSDYQQRYFGDEPGAPSGVTDR